MKTIGYCRVSTTGQATEGVSLEAQRAKIAAWCTANDAELIGMYVDEGISGARADNRPELQKAIAAACKNKCAFVAYSLSRVGRSTLDVLGIAKRLEKAKADLVFVVDKVDTTTASGKMVFRMLAVFSEFEKDLVSERTKAALRHKNSLGERVGGVPYGSRLSSDGIHIEPNTAEQRTVSLIHRLHGNGCSLRKIQAELQRRGVVNRSGNVQWRLNTLAGIVKRQKAA